MVSFYGMPGHTVGSGFFPYRALPVLCISSYVPRKPLMNEWLRMMIYEVFISLRYKIVDTKFEEVLKAVE